MDDDEIFVVHGTIFFFPTHPSRIFSDDWFLPRIENYNLENLEEVWNEFFGMLFPDSKDLGTVRSLLLLRMQMPKGSI